jgi:ubiquitin C
MPEMQIFVKSLSGKSVILNVKGSDTIESVKRKIENWDAIPLALLGLVFACPGQMMSRQMIDERTLGDYHVEKESTLYSVSRLISEVKLSLLITIFVKISAMKTLAMKVDLSTSIGFVKLQVREMEGIPVDEQALFFFRS